MSVGAVRSCICVGMPRNRISFADICKKLNLGNPQDAEFICAKVNKHIFVSSNIFGFNVFVSIVAQRVYDLQTIRDGVINAVIDKKNNCLQSRVRAYCSQMAYSRLGQFCFVFDYICAYNQENVDVYSTLEPRRAFHERIEFCLDLHNSAVKV